jgi:COMPASS component SWD3
MIVDEEKLEKNEININNQKNNQELISIGITPSLTENLILTELKEEDRRMEIEENIIQNYENRIFDINFKKIIECPYPFAPTEEKVECFSIQFEKFDNFLAAGYSNGCITVFNLENSNFKNMKASEFPVTSIRWKPHSDNKPKNILLSVTADGKITHWHTATGKALHTMEEKDNPIMCLDYSKDGMLFATAGNDKHVKLYDDNTKTLLKIMKPGSFNQPGHSNRIFAVNFHKENPNLIASGGWDNTIQFYDVRQGTIVNSIYGPHICGDSIDMKGDYLLTGSWAVKDQLQLWDLRMLKLTKNIAWENDQLVYPTYLYSAEFSKNSVMGDLIAVGGSNNNVIRVFEDETEKKLPQCFSKNLASPVYTVDFSHNGKTLAYGCGDGVIRLLNINKKGF